MAENGKSDLSELTHFGVFEAHEMLGVERSRLARWISEGEIEEPAIRVKSGPIWTRAQIERKLLQMYESAGSPYGKTVAGRERWATERRKKREARRGSRSRRPVAA